MADSGRVAVFVWRMVMLALSLCWLWLGITAGAWVPTAGFALFAALSLWLVTDSIVAARRGH
jgi:hypothetical protein